MTATHRSARVIAVIATSALAGFLALGGVAESAQSVGTNYYVSTASGCSDSGAGTSQAAPWCDFTPANAHTFVAGDQLLLARGAQWNQQLSLHGNGASGTPVTVDAYGTGSNPRIIRSGAAADVGVVLTNPNFWTLQNLEVGSAGIGILVKATTVGNQGLSLNNIYVHNVTGIRSGIGYSAPDYASTQDPAGTAAASANSTPQSAGIEFAAANVTYTTSQSLLSGISFNNVEGTHNMSSIHFEVASTVTETGQTSAYNAWTNITFNHLYLHDDNGPSIGCPDGIAITAGSNAVIMNSRFINESSCHTPTGTAAIYVAQTQNVNFFNNIISTVPNSGSPDQTGFDYEGFTQTTQIAGNYFLSNAGAGIEVLAIHGDFSTNNTIASNTFSGNAVSLERIGSDDTPTGTIANNVSADPAFESGTSFGGYTQTNNLSVVSPAFAAQDFSATQGGNNWTYQSGSGTSWTNLPYYDSTQRIWQASSTVNVPQVAQFEQHPGNGGTSVARTWTAPRAGTVSVRGIALKSDIGGGDGVDIRITKNGSTIWPTAGGTQHVGYNDQSGISTNLDNVTVAAGDVIRFETAAGTTSNNDTLSWTPSIAYLPRSATYEAEDGTLTGGAALNTNNPGYTGRGFVDSFTAVGAATSLRVNSATAGTAPLVIRYSAGAASARSVSLYVNGTKVGQLVFPPTANWSTWGSLTTNASLTAGINTIQLKYDSGDNGNLNIDSVGVPSTVTQAVYEAERGTLSGAAVNTNHANYTGTGFVDTWTAVGNSDTFAVSAATAGSHTVVVRYADGSASTRTMSLYANGTKVGQLTFPAVFALGDWDDWSTVSATVTLAAGANTVKLQYDSGDNGNVNIDNIAVS